MRFLLFVYWAKQRVQRKAKTSHFPSRRKLHKLLRVECSKTCDKQKQQLANKQRFFFFFLLFLDMLRWCVFSHFFKRKRVNASLAALSKSPMTSFTLASKWTKKKIYTKKQRKNVASRAECACETHANRIKSDVKTTRLQKDQATPHNRP